MPETSIQIDSLQDSIDQAIQELQEAGQSFHQRGWSLATSSNYSIAVSADPLLLLMTASGKHKGKLSPGDFAIIDSDLRILRAARRDQPFLHMKPSAEAALHTMIAKEFRAGSILHTHSVWATLLSLRHASEGSIKFQGLEMLKALNGITTHEASVSIPIFPNDQDIHALAELVKKNKDSISHAFLIAGHGIYTWGINFSEALRHLEALEFLLELRGREERTA